MDGKVSWLVVCWVTMLNGSVLLCLLQRCGISPSLRPALAGCSQVATNATQPVTCFPLRVQSSTADGPRALISAGTFSLSGVVGVAGLGFVRREGDLCQWRKKPI